MLLKMKRIQVIGPKNELDRVVDLLYREDTVHLEDVTAEVPGTEIALQKVRLEKAGDISDILGKIDAIFTTLPTIPKDREATGVVFEHLKEMSHDQVIAHAREVIRELETTTRNLASRKSELTLQITTLNRYAAVLNIIQPVEKELPMLEGFEVTILLIAKEYSQVIDLIRKEMEEITGNKFEMTSTTVDADTLATIMVFPKKHSEQVHAFIFSVNVNEVRLPREYMGRPFYEMYAMIEENKEKATKELKEIDERLSGLSSTWFQELSALRQVLRNMNDELAAFSNFGVSEFTFVIMGWVPKKLLGHVKDSVRSEFGDRVVVNELKTSWSEMEKAPVCYDNPKWVKPFEFIMQLVSPPCYREVDPCPLIAIFFPIFFGIMVGDVGYGIVILVFSLILKNRMKSAAWACSIADILLISSIPTIIFGFLYGEFFGDFGEMMGWFHPMHFLGITWNRIEAMIPMLVLAVGVGVLHVFIGLVIGMVNATRQGSKKHLSERLGMLLVLIGILLLVGMLANAIPTFAMIPSIALIVAGIPLIMYGAGVFGTLEIMSAVGNILSYARLMAIGMASVILAIVANRLGVTFEVLALGITVAILLHALNIILAMFSPSIHSVRLHLVECFSKFYCGGGTSYRPFGKLPKQEPEPA